MNAFEKILDFENQTISALISNMVKWLGFDTVVFETSQRSNVESGIWYIISMKKDGKQYSVSSQRHDLLKSRLIDFLNRHHEQTNAG